MGKKKIDLEKTGNTMVLTLTLRTIAALVVPRGGLLARTPGCALWLCCQQYSIKPDGARIKLLDYSSPRSCQEIPEMAGLCVK